ncbi:MAG: DNA polymerase III subunit delta, partial [Gloeomargarita sp. GMQP_bins_44]
FQKYGVIREFNPIPPWRTEELAALVREMAQEIPVALSQEAVAYLVAAIGNDRYRLEQELHKIALLRPEDPRPLQVAEIQPLVPPTTQTSLALAQAIRQGQVDQALHLWQDLLGMGEPPLRITATLVSQFRLWLWVKLAQMDRQVTPEKVVAMTNLGNPKRLYFLSKEVQGIPLAALAETLERLLALEWGLKQGAPATVIGPSTLISLSRLYSRGRFPAQ